MAYPLSLTEHPHMTKRIVPSEVEEGVIAPPP
jgi:hypothetical protein